MKSSAIGGSNFERALTVIWAFIVDVGDINRARATQRIMRALKASFVDIQSGAGGLAASFSALSFGATILKILHTPGRGSDVVPDSFNFRANSGGGTFH